MLPVPFSSVFWCRVHGGDAVSKSLFEDCLRSVLGRLGYRDFAFETSGRFLGQWFTEVS